MNVACCWFQHIGLPDWANGAQYRSAFAYGSLSLLPTLKPKITPSASRLDNGGWLNLTV